MEQSLAKNLELVVKVRGHELATRRLIMSMVISMPPFWLESTALGTRYRVSATSVRSLRHTEPSGVGV